MQRGLERVNTKSSEQAYLAIKYIITSKIVAGTINKSYRKSSQKLIFKKYMGMWAETALENLGFSSSLLRKALNALGNPKLLKMHCINIMAC